MQPLRLHVPNDLLSEISGINVTLAVVLLTVSLPLWLYFGAQHVNF